MSDPNLWPNPESFRPDQSLDEKCTGTMLLLLTLTQEMRGDCINGETNVTAHSKVFEPNDDSDRVLRIKQLIGIEKPLLVFQSNPRENFEPSDVTTEARIFTLDAGIREVDDDDFDDIDDHEAYDWTSLVAFSIQERPDEELSEYISPIKIHIFHPENGHDLTQEEKLKLLLLLNSLQGEAEQCEINISDISVGLPPPYVITSKGNGKYAPFTHKDTPIVTQCGECHEKNLICMHAPYISN